MTSRESLSFAFRCSVDLGRAHHEIDFLRDELAKEKARTIKLGELIHTAADHLSKCKVTAGSQVRYLQPRIDKAGIELIRALALVDAVVETEVIDLTDSEQLTSALSIGGPGEC